MQKRDALMLAYTWESDFTRSSANLQVLHFIQSGRSWPIPVREE